MLDARSEAIEGSIREGRRGQARGRGRAREVHVAAGRGPHRGRRIREQARDDGTKIVAELREQASVRGGAHHRERAGADRGGAPSGARLAAQSEVGNLALDLAGGVIGETLSDDAKAQAVVDRFLAELEASEKATK